MQCFSSRALSLFLCISMDVIIVAEGGVILFLGSLSNALPQPKNCLPFGSGTRFSLVFLRCASKLANCTATTTHPAGMHTAKRERERERERN
uniref:Putative secreted protein n=1 Tax=Anopheles darlingi TaxID=43151 RepID=A0A2M4DR50_ANODA